MTWEEAMQRAASAETADDRRSWVDYARELRLGGAKPEVVAMSKKSSGGSGSSGGGGSHGGSRGKKEPPPIDLGLS
jgi:uncharacterized membrane protein YgcG